MDASPDEQPLQLAEESPSDGLRLVDLSEVDLPQVLALLDSSLGAASVARTSEFFRWKHEASPFGRSFGIAAVNPTGTLAALRLFMRWRFVAGARSYEAVRAVDTATHPDFQRRGLFRRLTLELVRRVEKEGISFVFNTPNAKSRPGYLTMGWQDVGRLPLLARPLLGRLVARSLRMNAASDTEGADPLAELASVGVLLSQPELPAFLERWSRDEHRLHTPRDPAYLRWRYLAVPGILYRAAWHFEGESGAVAIVRARTRSGRLEAGVSELLVSHDRQGMQAGVRLARRIATLGVDYAVALGARGTAERRVASRAGFVPCGWLGPRMTVRPVRASGVAPPIRSPCSWRLSAGDAELF